MYEKKYRFPRHILADNMPEIIDVEWDDESSIYGDDSNLFYLNQELEHRDALEYAQKNFPFHNLSDLSAQDLAAFIKELHKRAARTLLWLECSQTGAGAFTTSRSFVLRETGLSGLDYELPSLKNEFFSEKNYKILTQKFDRKYAENYKDFCKELFKKMHEILQGKSLYEASKVGFQDVMEDSELKSHPGYASFFQIIRVFNIPEKILEAFDAYCRELCNLFKKNTNPFQIAAYSLELTKIHPFPNGNGRVTRILMNCILMAYNMTPINLDTCKKQYYQAIENSYENTRMLDNFLRKKSECSPKDNNEIDYFSPNEIIPVLAPGINVVNCKDRYEAVKTENMSAYASVVNNEHRATLNKEYLSFFAYSPFPEAGVNLTYLAAQRKKFVTTIIDADYCSKKAANCHREKKYSMAIGYYMQASVFYIETKHYSKAMRCQYQAAVVSKLQNNNEGAYDFALLAKSTALSLNKDTRVIDDFINELQCVTVYREELAFNRLLCKYNLPDRSELNLQKALRNAAVNNYIEDLKFLLQYVQNINAADLNPKFLRTALHWAAIKKHQECYDLLIEKGADDSIRDADNKTALDYKDPDLQSASTLGR